MSRKTIKKHGRISFVLGLTIVLAGAYFAIPQSHAAAISNREMLISDSRPSQTGVTYDFEGDHSGTAVRCLEVVFCTTASGGCTGPTGFDASSATIGASSTWAGWTHALWTASTFLATRVLYTATSNQTGGSNFSFNTASIANSSAVGTYFARVTTYSDEGACTTSVDTGVAAFAIISGVTVSATVAETLTLTISSVTNANCDTSFEPFAGPDSLATSVPFGELSAADTFNHSCQDIFVSTNAGSGFSLTGQEATSLLSGTDTIDDSTGDSGSMTETVSSAWATASGNAGFGYACEDISGATCVMTATSSFKQFACVGSDANCDPGSGSETAQNVMTSSTATTATSRIQYKLTVDGVQEAGDYTTTVIYIATPVF